MMPQARLENLYASSPRNPHPYTILYFEYLYCPSNHLYSILSWLTFYLFPPIHFYPTFSPLAVSVSYPFPSPTVQSVSILQLSLGYELPQPFCGFLAILAAT